MEDAAQPPGLPRLPPPSGQEPPAPPGPRPFGPLNAFLVFLAYLGGQFAAGLVAGVIVGILSVMGPRRPMAEVLRDAMPAVLLFSLSLAGAAALLTTRLLVGRPLRGRAGEGFGLLAANARQMLAGVAAGLLLGLLFFVVIRLLPPERADTVLSQVASTKTGYWALVLLALVIAPPVEEFVFRGVLYEGLRARMPAAAAATIVTLLFTLLHATELVHYWPGFGLIALLGLLTLALRLRTGSLFPAVAAHFAYNACAMAQAWS